MNFAWDDAADAELRKLRADSQSFSQCAAQIGCTRNAAIGRAHRLGIDRRIPQKMAMLGKPRPAPLPPEPPRPSGKRIGVM